MELIDGINGPGDGLGPRHLSANERTDRIDSSFFKLSPLLPSRDREKGVRYPFDPADNANEIFP